MSSNQRSHKGKERVDYAQSFASLSLSDRYDGPLAPRSDSYVATYSDTEDTHYGQFPADDYYSCNTQSPIHPAAQPPIQSSSAHLDTQDTHYGQYTADAYRSCNTQSSIHPAVQPAAQLPPAYGSTASYGSFYPTASGINSTGYEYTNASTSTADYDTHLTYPGCEVYSTGTEARDEHLRHQMKKKKKKEKRGETCIVPTTENRTGEHRHEHRRERQEDRRGERRDEERNEKRTSSRNVSRQRVGKLKPSTPLSSLPLPTDLPSANYAANEPTSEDKLSTSPRDDHGDQPGLQRRVSIPKELPPSSSFMSTSSPSIRSNNSLAATSEHTLAKVLRGGPMLVSDHSTGPAFEVRPRDMSNMSDGESFETGSSSERLNSPASLAEWRRNILIDRTISWMISYMNSKLAVLAFKTHGTCEEQCPRGSSWSQDKIRGSSKGQTAEKRKRCHNGGHGSGDEDSDDDDYMPPPPQGSRAGDNEKIVEFACPFLKHNPQKYGNIRPCSTTGWKAIFRLKEHLYRCHQLPQFQCIRCCTTFRSSEQLLEHSRADTACDVVRDESCREGISQEQLVKLKSRKKNREAHTEHEKWIQVYKILFPNDYLIPSPYFQRGTPAVGRESLLTALREHVGRELPRLIKPRLEESVDASIREALGPDMLEGLVRDIFTQILSTFSQKTSNSSDAELPKTDEGTAVPMSETFSNFTQLGPGGFLLHNEPSFGIEHDLSAFRVPSDQPESSQQASKRIHNESSKWQIGYAVPSDGEPGPSNFLSGGQVSCFPSTTTNNTTEGSSLSDLFNFEDFHDEYAAWLGQTDEGSTRADSGYFSLQPGGSMENVTGKGKEKEAGDIHTDA